MKMTKTIKLNDSEIELIKDALIEKQTLSSVASRYKKIIAKLSRSTKPIKVSSRKAKGRSLQKWAVNKIAELLDYVLPENKDDSHIRSREMGQNGVDVVLSKLAKQKFPFAIECKNQEKINIAEFMKQAKSNETEYTWPILILKNKTLPEPLIIMEWGTFSALYHGTSIYKDICLD
jgi:hypothetical protein